MVQQIPVPPPQLLAIPMLVRYEDWTFREAEVRLNEHGEWRRALGLRQPRAPLTMCWFFSCLPEESIGRALAEAARLGIQPLPLETSPLVSEDDNRAR